MAERLSDRSPSAESQPKFPGCSHFRMRNDNHLRCQQCRLNEGQPLCTQDSLCLVCKDWLPEAQGRRCGEGGKESQGTWCYGRLRRNPRSGRYASVPLQAFQQRRVVQSQTNQDKSHKFLGPQNRNPWFLRWKGPALTGRTAVASRSTDRKRRHGADNRQDSPRHQSSRRREDERSRPSYSGGSSSRKRAESGSVSKASDTRPSASSSQHHRHHQSSGDHRSLSSASSRRIQTASHRPVIMREDERAPIGRVIPTSSEGMCGCLPKSSSLLSRPGRFMLNQPQKFKSRHQWRTARQTTGRLQFKSRHRWRPARQVLTRRQVTARTQVTAQP